MLSAYSESQAAPSRTSPTMMHVQSTLGALFPRSNRGLDRRRLPRTDGSTDGNTLVPLHDLGCLPIRGTRYRSIGDQASNVVLMFMCLYPCGSQHCSILRIACLARPSSRPLTGCSCLRLHRSSQACIHFDLIHSTGASQTHLLCYALAME